MYKISSERFYLMRKQYFPLTNSLGFLLSKQQEKDPSQGSSGSSVPCSRLPESKPVPGVAPYLPCCEATRREVHSGCVEPSMLTLGRVRSCPSGCSPSKGHCLDSRASFEEVYSVRRLQLLIVKE